MIKAIETRYKGYRFRSRLEARWAVFFDALGIKWEYEMEGFDLGDTGWYLPDFWLPEVHSFVEIKPDYHRKQQRKIYAAGRMDGYRGENWRGDIDMHFFSFDEYVDSCRNGYETVAFNGHLYVGPYAIDEFGGHGDDGHFNLIMDDTTHKGLCRAGEEMSSMQEAVSIFCRRQIEQCDLFFAWLDSNDRYGTLVEIGYAKALGKEIWIGVPNGESCGYWNDSQLWFAEQLADKIQCAGSALEAFSRMDDPMSHEELKCSELSIQSKSFAWIFCGAPGADDFSVTEFVYGKRHVVGGELTFAGGTIGSILSVVPRGWAGNSSRNMLRTAYNAARSARFEHGETPKV